MREIPISRPRGLRTILSVVLSTIALAACGGSSPSQATDPGPTPSPTAVATAVPATIARTVAPTASGPSALCAVGTDECVIRAGSYTTSPFAPAFSFSIEKAWNNTRAFAAGGGISAQGGGLSWIAGTADAWVGATEDLKIGSQQEVARFISLLNNEDGYSVDAASSTTIGGVAATQVDVTRSAEKSTGAGFEIEEDRYVFGPGTESRVYFVETSGTWTFLVVEAEHSLDAFMTVAQPVLDGILWE